MRTFIFIRRQLILDVAEKNFIISKDEILEEQGNSYEEALDTLLRKNNAIEGNKSKLSNNGYPLDIASPIDQAMYHASYGLAVYSYEKQNEKNEGYDWRKGFIEELKSSGESNEEDIYKGVYADPYLMYPQGLTIEDIRQKENHVSYIFYPEGGRFKGDLHRYLYIDSTVFKGSHRDINKWHFQIEEVELPSDNDSKPYCFRGKLLSFAHHSAEVKEKKEAYLVKLFRGEDGQYLLYVDFFDQRGKRKDPVSIIRSSSSQMIYKRLQSKLNYAIKDKDAHGQSCYKKFIDEIRVVLNIC